MALVAATAGARAEERRRQHRQREEKEKGRGDGCVVGETEGPLVVVTVAGKRVEEGRR